LPEVPFHPGRRLQTAHPHRPGHRSGPGGGITAANRPEAEVTNDITADLTAQRARLVELHIDRAYLSSALVRHREPDLEVFCKAWRVRNTTGRHPRPSSPWTSTKVS
jgi:hypothetical protein